MTPAEQITLLRTALKPFAAMARDGDNPDEVVLQRGAASDMTLLSNGDFTRALLALSDATPKPASPDTTLSPADDKRIAEAHGIAEEHHLELNPVWHLDDQGYFCAKMSDATGGKYLISGPCGEIVPNEWLVAVYEDTPDVGLEVVGWTATVQCWGIDLFLKISNN